VTAVDDLARTRAGTLAQIAALTAEFDEVVAASASSNADDEHDPEGATIAFERSQVETLVRRLRRHLADLDAAAERVAAGTYGSCQVCGRAIPAARLEARPAALTCVGCAP
jgi:RNA polymerase-binding transcription factor DksA